MIATVSLWGKKRKKKKLCPKGVKISLLFIIASRIL